MPHMWYDQKPIIALAPMADMTDSPFCRICREVAGSGFVIFREMVSAEAIVRGNAKTLKMCEFEDVERPMVIQLFGANPETMAKAAKIVIDKFHPDGIDINMGCPVPKIAGKSLAGAALMKHQDKAVEIIKKIKAENLGVPLSIKTRLGWGSENDILEFAPKLEQAGADLITIHGRTKTQGYSGKANWEKIREVKKILSIPVIANGDINSPEDMQKCLELTGADGVMIGRSALGNPWIFTDRIPEKKELVGIILKHADLHLKRYGEKTINTFRKHLAYYFKGDRVFGIENLKEIKSRLVRVGSMNELKEILGELI